MNDFGFIVVALAIVGFALVSGRVQRSVITPPMVFVLFGLLVGPAVLRLVEFDVEAGWIVRMVPVAMSLVGAGLRSDSRVFLGWFGPRGIASILFALLVLERSALPAREEILVVVITAVCLSVIAHGLTAYPAASWYGARVANREGGMEEHAPVSEMPVRLRY